MTMSPKQSALKPLAGQARLANPLAIALPCAALAFAALAATVHASTPAGPKCAPPALTAPGFDSLAPQERPACIRIPI